MASLTDQIQAKYGRVAGQFIRFALIGVLNTAINFAVLNLLSLLTGVTKGEKIIWMAMVAFAVATINSYYFNKLWTFKDKSTDEAKKFSIFLIVSILGAMINSGTVYLISTYTYPLFGLSSHLWLNVANLFATGISLIWNFIGYKLIVFKK